MRGSKQSVGKMQGAIRLLERRMVGKRTMANGWKPVVKKAKPKKNDGATSANLLLKAINGSAPDVDF